MIPITAYFDASGRSDDPTVPTVFVSGCVSSERKWLQFETEWCELLERTGIERPFRMSRFYADFRERQEARAAFIDAALRIIKRRTYKTFSSGVELEAHRKAASERELPLWVADPYALCAAKVIGQVGTWIKNRNVTKQMAFVFELGDLGRGKFITALEEAKLRFNPNFASKEDVPAFDPGDLVAWLHARTVRRHLEGRPNDVELFARELARRVPGRDAWGWHGVDWFSEHCWRWPRTPTP